MLNREKKKKTKRGKKKKPLPCVKTGRPGANSITATEIKFHRCFVRFAREKKEGGGREESPRSHVEFRLLPSCATVNDEITLKKIVKFV